jgi:hypothetical protein
MSEVSNPTPPTQTKMAQFDPAHHAQTDPWIPEGQADDRTPMDGSVRNSDENPCGQRRLPGDAIN